MSHKMSQVGAEKRLDVRFVVTLAHPGEDGSKWRETYFFSVSNIGESTLRVFKEIFDNAPLVEEYDVHCDVECDRLKEIATELGVPPTMEHIKQGIRDYIGWYDEEKAEVGRLKADRRAMRPWWRKIIGMGREG